MHPLYVPQKNNTEVIPNDRDLFHGRKIVHHQPFQFFRSVPFRPMFPNRHATPIQKVQSSECNV